MVASRLRDEYPWESVVYFVEAVGLERIKIGWTTDIVGRMSNLRTSSPVDLRLIVAVPGDADREARLHAEFAEERIWPGREWFHASERLRLRIRTHCFSRIVSDAFADDDLDPVEEAV